MARNSLLQDAEYLRGDQYRDSRNLGARSLLHQLYGTNPQGWFEWVMVHMDLRPGCKVLECGCGPGWLWRNNLEALPVGCQFTLTDLSPGMVAEAEEALSATYRDFRFLDADIAELPFDDQTFDIVVANHMLYHVPDRSRALSEVQRVLKPNGRFFAATIGDHHMGELWDLRMLLAPELTILFQQSSKEFSLENGKGQLAPWFNQIKIYRYENNLKVTDVEPLLAYILSSTQSRNRVEPEQLHKVRQTVQNSIEEHDSFDISTSAGLFVAQNETL